MNPRLVRDLDREGAAILQLIDGIPPRRPRDLSGHIDAKREACVRLAALMKRWREEGAGQGPGTGLATVSSLPETGRHRPSAAEGGRER